MKACAICDDRTSLLTCQTVGAICFDCWGSGIHEVMKRKARLWWSHEAMVHFCDAIKMHQVIKSAVFDYFKNREVAS